MKVKKTHFCLNTCTLFVTYFASRSITLFLTRCVFVIFSCGSVHASSSAFVFILILSPPVVIGLLLTVLALIRLFFSPRTSHCTFWLKVSYQVPSVIPHVSHSHLKCEVHTSHMHYTHSHTVKTHSTYWMYVCTGKPTHSPSHNRFIKPLCQREFVSHPNTHIFSDLRGHRPSQIFAIPFETETAAIFPRHVPLNHEKKGLALMVGSGSCSITARCAAPWADSAPTPQEKSTVGSLVLMVTKFYAEKLLRCFAISSATFWRPVFLVHANELSWSMPKQQINEIITYKK